MTSSVKTPVDGNWGKLAPLGREWRIGPRSELAAATIRMAQFEGPEHAHPEAQVAILLSGSSATFSRQGLPGTVNSPVVPSSFVYIRPWELHRTQWHGMTELLNLYWAGDFLRELADQTGCVLHESPVTHLPYTGIREPPILANPVQTTVDLEPGVVGRRAHILIR